MQVESPRTKMCLTTFLAGLIAAISQATGPGHGLDGGWAWLGRLISPINQKSVRYSNYDETAFSTTLEETATQRYAVARCDTFQNIGTPTVVMLCNTFSWAMLTAFYCTLYSIKVHVFLCTMQPLTDLFIPGSRKLSQLLADSWEKEIDRRAVRAKNGHKWSFAVPHQSRTEFV